MLTIRMQRTGRTGFATFRVVVQDSRFAPSSGRVVAKIGHYNPHTKETTINKEKVVEYLGQGAQPSPRVVRLLTAEKIALPNWVKVKNDDKKRKIRNPEKLRKHQPKEVVVETKIEEPIVETPEVDTTDEIIISEESTVEATPENVTAEKEIESEVVDEEITATQA